uniref:Docking protein 2 n=1 Tax=Erpetoichthys calabaricus TaxID=27687 RepID=A0A8C4S2U3_ERPCA
MEGAIKKQGMLYLQQQRFGKKWKKTWCVVYGESICSIARIEILEFKDGVNISEKTEKMLKKQDNKKVIKLNDCIRVTDIEMDGCPKESIPFLVETTEKLYVFAAESSEMEDWVQTLCELAFPMKWNESQGPVKKNSIHRPVKGTSTVAMEENSLYSSRATGTEFKVVIRKTDASERCNTRGTYLLVAEEDSLILKDLKSRENVFLWPYKFLRRFGRDKTTFSFEAGRRCTSGEGNFEFETKHGGLIFQAIESAIQVKKSVVPEQKMPPPSSEGDVQVPPRSLPSVKEGFYSTINEWPSDNLNQTLGRIQTEISGEQVVPGMRNLTLDPNLLSKKPQMKSNPNYSASSSRANVEAYAEISLFPQKMPASLKEKKVQKGPLVSANQESEYAVPFDNVMKNLMATSFSNFPLPQQEQILTEEDTMFSFPIQPQMADPLYDSIDDQVVVSKMQRSRESLSKDDHIYDEPEGCAFAAPTKGTTPGLYDNPEEVRGSAWKLKGTLADPTGHEFPYNPQVDDYAVPKMTKKAVCSDQPYGQQTTTENKKESQDDTYDNVLIKITAR